VYGVDAQNTQAFGNPPGSWDFLNGFDHGIYGWALPQAYVQVARGAWNVKAGHFFTPVGYEVVNATGNFFYSHAFTMNNSEPFTHTGVLSTYTVSENLEVYTGWTLGWDTGFDQLNGGSNVLSGFKAGLSDSLSLIYINTIGDLGARGQGYSHSVVLDFDLTDKWNYVFQSDLVATDAVIFDDQVSINQYLFYNYTDCLALGGRMEWWKTDGISFYETTSGVNYRPHANLIFRPEVRKQWSPGLDYDETILGCDAILTF
jgi:Putative beta-barrel porin-2, OmpL-like. bbp2